MCKPRTTEIPTKLATNSDIRTICAVRDEEAALSAGPTASSETGSFFRFLLDLAEMNDETHSNNEQARRVDTIIKAAKTPFIQFAVDICVSIRRKNGEVAVRFDVEREIGSQDPGSLPWYRPNDPSDSMQSFSYDVDEFDRVLRARILPVGTVT